MFSQSATRNWRECMGSVSGALVSMLRLAIVGLLVTLPFV